MADIGAREAARLILDARRVLFFLHVSPDGDTIGSSLAVCRAARALGKEAWCVGVDPVPRIYQFLPGWTELFRPWQELDGEWDLGVLLDCGDRSRVGPAEPLLGRCRRTLNVDHHATNGRYGDYNWLDFRAAAVGEMAYRLVVEMGAPVDPPTATCLYTAIVTDTGSFRYDSTTPATHEIAARLIEAGVLPYRVAEAVWESETPERLRLLSACLATLQLHAGGRVATLRVTRDMLAATGATDEDVDGMVNFARSIAGVEVGLLFRETGNGKVRVNLRSRGGLDVSRVAERFGGGGHPRAAGCTVEGDIAAVEAQVVAAAAEALG
ncbi:DHH family phosphoesterase [Caldinitratiruptor microaerophilus]|uniref:Phosphoesterase RecJ-like protein n=1 Tax=Caldinitratiruptor microaerophilus TaxID=671077 RepID=A0AA35G740_9FIRM|nr:bifunctional oligoribonuclease/PAP phosphatase NrnA [Caldinitratiruptor microaerophilus]BDG59405.1 phosphoesterase RecJ-like protein [Caldinitratiruptor microaerophilus]